jgi:hypothetical protein
VPFTDIRSIRRHTPALGWQYIIVVLSSGEFFVVELNQLDCMLIVYFSSVELNQFDFIFIVLYFSICHGFIIFPTMCNHVTSIINVFYAYIL